MRETSGTLQEPIIRYLTKKTLCQKLVIKHLPSNDLGLHPSYLFHAWVECFHDLPRQFLRV